MSPRSAYLDLPSGIGLVVANMIGAGVLLSAGFMAQELRPLEILVAWGIGAGLAMCGAISYGALVAHIPRSGGEYRYLADLLHPAAGFMAGGASLLIGFAGPIALDGIAAGAFLATLWPGAPAPEVTGTVIIVGLTVVHAAQLDLSRNVQNLLVVLKLVGIVGFVAVGLALGSWALPSWTPPHAPASPIGPLLTQQLWIAFAFSGWNAAVYAASEFHDPARTVTRAMLVGTGLVAVLYALVNFVLLANLAPDQLSIVLSSDLHRITLGHLVATDLLGDVGGFAMSGFVVLAMVSAMSAMTVVGPRVYAEMARDGVLPRMLAGSPAPVGSVVLQSSIALFLLHTHSVLELVSSIGAALLLFSGLSVAALLGLARTATPPPPHALVASVVYLLGVIGILGLSLRQTPHLGISLLVLVLVGLAGWGLSRMIRPAP